MEISLDQSLNQTLLSSEISATALSKPQILAEFEQQMRATYPPSNSHPYHNWNHHIPDVLKAALFITDHLVECGGKVDRDVVIAAVLGHDAGYGYDFRAQGFTSRETLAADLSEKALLQLGADPVFCTRVGNAIRATESGVEPKSIEEKILRAADLRSLASNHESFKKHSQLLHQEFQNARGTSIEYSQFFRWQVDIVLSNYLALMIQLTPDATDAQGRSRWHQGAVSNICATDWQAPTIGLINPKLLPQDFYERREMLGNELILAAAPASELREQLKTLRDWTNRNGVPALVVPSQGTAVSLPNGGCSEVHVALGDDLTGVREAIRVARTGASVYVYLSPEKLAGEKITIDAISEMAGVKGIFNRYKMNEFKVLCLEVA